MTITILDGGMGRELRQIGAPFAQPEWSALSLIEAPEMVGQAHQNFIDAGAQVITTNTYALVPFHIGQERFETRGFELAEMAAKIAKEKARQANVKVAGSLPPAFGSYRPDLFEKNTFESILTPLIDAQEDHVDLWIIETAASVIEANSIVDLIKNKSNKPIWIAFTLENRDNYDQPSQLRSKEPLDQALKSFAFAHVVDAILYNCSQPEEMEDAIKTTKSIYPNIKTGAFANSFSETKRSHAANEGVSSERDDITPDKYLDFAKSWIDAGATIIGGCCGIGPKHIRKLAGFFN